jgi:hypothetical protein
MADNPDGNMTNENFYSQLSIFFEGDMGFRSKRE